MNRKKAFEELIQSCTIVLPEHRIKTWNKKLEAIFRYGQTDQKDIEDLLSHILSDPKFVDNVQKLTYKCFSNNILPWEKLPLSEDEKEQLSIILWNHSLIRVLKLLVKRAEDNYGRFLR